MNPQILTNHVRDSFRRIGADVRAFVARPSRDQFDRVAAERIRVRGDVFELVVPAGGQVFLD